MNGLNFFKTISEINVSHQLKDSDSANFLGDGSKMTISPEI